jgi:hypothetical protein
MTVRTTAVGGTRTVPAPDPIAREYLLLALRLDHHIPGLVDSYYGPADLKARVDLDPVRPPARLAEDAAILRERLGSDVTDPARRHWLELQLAAFETHAAGLAGRHLPYLETIGRCFAWRPARHTEESFEAAAAELDRLLPGREPLAARLAADDEAWTVPVDAARRLVDGLVARFRDRAAVRFGLPDGEDLRVSFVRDQPWSGYNWYDGGRRSRVDLNTDLPLRIPSLIATVAHETYPGHHLEHATKEEELVDRRGWLEASLLAINAPESLISEGLANVAGDFVVERSQEPALLAELASDAGIALARDPGALRAAAERRVAMMEPRKQLDASRVDAAILRHAEGWSHDQALDYLIRVGRFAPSVAAKRLEFIEHRLWRLYVFAYVEGERLVRRWLDAGPAEERIARFGRLLREPLTPVSIARELGIDSPAVA